MISKNARTKTFSNFHKLIGIWASIFSISSTLKHFAPSIFKNIENSISVSSTDLQSIPHKASGIKCCRITWQSWLFNPESFQSLRLTH